MSVTVRDLLKLERLSSAKVITGADGLDRKVSRVNFTDTPVNEEVDFDLLSKGDVFICSFYAMQDDEDVLYQNIAFYIRMGSACRIMKRCYTRASTCISALAARAASRWMSLSPSCPSASWSWRTNINIRFCISTG